MEMILAITLTSLLLFVAAVVARVVDIARSSQPTLTVADIKTRLAAEPPRTYVPISRGW
ncbi:hypothetical protein ACFXHA_45315 [Nocardia sp. NPDC059240]|uniref:hypothetical protein n=1 Tax=Nocardia sp. NPDC059240 TaxID=3346786 RepID=UPI00367FC1B6